MAHLLDLNIHMVFRPLWGKHTDCAKLLWTHYYRWIYKLDSITQMRLLLRSASPDAPRQICGLASCHVFQKENTLSPCCDGSRSGWQRSFAVSFHVTANTTKCTECWGCYFLKGRWRRWNDTCLGGRRRRFRVWLTSWCSNQNLHKLLRVNHSSHCTRQQWTASFLNYEAKMCWKGNKEETATVKMQSEHVFVFILWCFSLIREEFDALIQ